LTIQAYFGVWNNARDVRVAYHTTMVETLHYLNAHSEIGPDVAISTITPGRFHDPAIARMVLKRDDLRIRWFDGRSALVIPAATSTTYLFSKVAALEPILTSYLQGKHTDQIILRRYDFDPIVDIIKRNIPPVSTSPQMTFGNILSLLDSRVTSTQVHPGDSFHVLTFWQISGRTDRELNLFTHALNDARQVIAQQDSLGVPSSGWVVGDSFIQVHTITIPPDTQPGTLQLEIGVYTEPDIVRLSISFPDGQPAGDSLIIGSVEVVAP
jgi:hypothetical protein